ncbi:hypothetical protein AWB64_00474 [Caballeronia sordidicola]|uniref:Uncharacterized protein n=1 Tax=Caballeronia sordidicola TaxID=196367 RepID=A0A158EY55_CABSO|nr:hypothetical protein [Caballeronia sordidicola]SAL12089.1 hypothetical protein AWB64_00474 [Caballeronia sordidicola]
MFDRAFLWEATCLAANLEPPKRDIWYQDQLREFPAAFHLVWEAVNRDGSFIALPMVNISGRMLHSVNIEQFSYWASRKGIDIPDALKIRAQNYAQRSELMSSTPTPSEEQSERVIVHTTKTRINVLDSVIDTAIHNTKSNAQAVVFDELRRMALDEAVPFTGDVNSESLMYTDGGSVKALTKKALGLRLTRRRKTSSG